MSQISHGSLCDAKILVTGAAGFIGYSVAKRLCAEGAQVLGIDNISDYYDPELKLARIADLKSTDAFTFKRGDLCDSDFLNAQMQAFRPNQIIHMAAQAGVRYSIDNPRAYIDANLIGFFNVLEQARHLRVGHFVFASSSSVYGLNTKLPYSTRDTTDHPVSLYAATKKSNEVMAHSYAHLFGLPTSGLRFFTVYGPWGRPDMAVHSFTKKILKGEEIELFNSGHHRRDFTFIDDAVSAVLLTLLHPPQSLNSWDSGQPMLGASRSPFAIHNVGGGSPVELKELIEGLERVIGKKAITKTVDLQPGDVLETFADISELKKLQWAPRTHFSAGIAKFYDWYRSYYH